MQLKIFLVHILGVSATAVTRGAPASASVRTLDAAGPPPSFNYDEVCERYRMLPFSRLHAALTASQAKTNAAASATLTVMAAMAAPRLVLRDQGPGVNRPEDRVGRIRGMKVLHGRTAGLRKRSVSAFGDGAALNGARRSHTMEEYRQQLILLIGSVEDGASSLEMAGSLGVWACEGSGGMDLMCRRNSRWSHCRCYIRNSFRDLVVNRAL